MINNQNRKPDEIVIVNGGGKNNCQPILKKWKRIFLSWEKWCEKKNISKLQSCLNFVSSYKKIDKVIIGVADEKELIQILKCIKKISKNYPKKIFSNDIKLIDSRKWKKT